MTTISSGFIGDFKLGDNIVYNLKILSELYAIQKSGTSGQLDLLRKPIIVTIASIAEAVLYDLYLRINHFTREGVASIPQHVLDDIRTKTVDEFAKYIDNAKSKSLLGNGDEPYSSLHELRKLRNRVHIQNTKDYFERDEPIAFSEARQRAAEKTLCELLQYLAKTYSRPPGLKCVDDFVLPW